MESKLIMFPFKVKTLVSWPGEQKGDLGFIENEIIEVIDINDDIWWRGRLRRNKKEGIFPKEFVEKLDTNKVQLHSKVNDQHNQHKSLMNIETTCNNQFMYNNNKKLENCSISLNQFGYQGKKYKTLNLTNKDLNRYFETFYFEHSQFSYDELLKLYKIKIKEIKIIEDIMSSLFKKKNKHFSSCEQSKINFNDMDNDKKQHLNFSKSKSLNYFQNDPKNNTTNDLKIKNFCLSKKSESKNKENNSKENTKISRSDKNSVNDTVKLISNLNLTNETSNDIDKSYLLSSLNEISGLLKFLNQSKSDNSDNTIILDSNNSISLESLNLDFNQKKKNNSCDHTLNSYINKSICNYNNNDCNEKHYSKNKIHLNENSIFNHDHDVNKENLDFLLTPSKSGNFLKKILKINQDKDFDKWLNVKTGLNRTNSLTLNDIEQRSNRELRKNKFLLVDSESYFRDINKIESKNEKKNLIFDVNYFENVDKYVMKYEKSHNLNDLISDLIIKFDSSIVNQIRAIFIHFCKFKIYESSNDINYKLNVDKVIQKNSLTVYEANFILNKYLNKMNIKSVINYGYLKKPDCLFNETNIKANHHWLTVKIMDIFLVLDIFCFNNGSLFNIYNKENKNEFYFLTTPSNIISTHISFPKNDIYSFKLNNEFLLRFPGIYSGFFKNNLKFHMFNTALCYLKDLEIFEMTLEVDSNTEVFSTVQINDFFSDVLTLTQTKWIEKKRIVKIKAVLNEKNTSGFLKVFAGKKGMQKSSNIIHELALSIPLFHSGIFEPLKFVARYPTIQSHFNDLYIIQPQNNAVIYKNSYTFKISQFPSVYNKKITPYKIVIKSPSGKIFKLQKSEQSLTYDLYEKVINCSTLGKYVCLITGDTGVNWYLLSEWVCFQNV